MAETGFIFTSPGVKFRERDLTFVTRNVGVTTLGLVGETPKGPAFEAIFVEDTGIERTRFGDLNNEKLPDGNLKYQLPYVAQKYLEQSNQLYITRILGLSGYDAGDAWGITLSAGVDLSTSGDTTVQVVTTGQSFTDSTFLGTTITATGQTGTNFTGFTKTGTTSFSGVRDDFNVITFDTAAGTGTTDSTGTTVTGTSFTDIENMVVGVLRSRATITDANDVASTTDFDATSILITTNNTNVGTGDVFLDFTLNAVSGASTEQHIVSVNPNSRNFVSKVIGDKPKGKNNKIYVDSIYPDLIKKLDADGKIYGINTALLSATTSAFGDFVKKYQTPETPFVVSELQGNSVSRLFKFVLISDGNAANKEVKISIENINPATKEFDVTVRDFNDTDENIVPLESFRKCTMQRNVNGYIGNRIGTADGDYDLLSSYIMVDVDANAPEDAFPAGFEGYFFRAMDATTTGTVSAATPQIFYKTGYTSNEQSKFSRTYLGVSEKGYDSDNGTLRGTGINSDYFKYIGAVQTQSSISKTKGFHMDSGATSTFIDGTITIGEFEVGADQFQTSTDVALTTNAYNNVLSRKFTLVPMGGFDGWNEHRISRSNTDLFKLGATFDGVPDGSTSATNDWQSWEQGINIFDNPEQVTINLFATPGINFSDHLALANHAITIIEQERADSLYVLDAPDLVNSVTLPQDIVALLDAADIDSSYTSIYYPWVQEKDTVNGGNLYLPPTLEVVNSIAFNDNVKFPWWAPAGLTRGVTDAKNVRRKLKTAERGVLQDGRINPMAFFPLTGVAIFGQKTLQIKDSALNRVNVRRLLLQLKVLIANVAIRLVFDPNDQVTRDEFVNKVNPIMDSVKRERGLQEYQVKMDDSINTPESADRLELYGEIKIKPTLATEFIGITFTITPQGASFDD